VVRNLRTALAGSLDAVFEPGVIERSSRNLWMVARGLRLRGQDERRPSRRRGAAQCPSDPVCGQEERDDPSQLDGIFWIYRLSRLKRDRVVKRFDKTQRTQASGD
jgi:peptide deformylase